jgi:hypothetical protein
MSSGHPGDILRAGQRLARMGLDTSIEILSLVFQVLLVWRCFAGGCSREYPIFFSLAFYNLCRSVLFPVLKYTEHPGFASFFWLSELVSWLLWFGVCWEIFRHIFPHGSTLRRIAGCVLVFSEVLAGLLFWTLSENPGTLILPDLLRKAGVAVGLWLGVNLGVAKYYAVQMGRNLEGMSCGLGLIVAVSVINFSAYGISGSFFSWLHIISPSAYLAGISIWIWALWRYVPRGVTRADIDGQEIIVDWAHAWSRIKEAFRRVARS